MAEPMTAGEEPWVPADTFGSRLALIRQAKHWNVKDAAEACGLNDQSWRNWEAGKRCRDLLEVARQIAAVTGVDEGWLVMGGALGPGSRTGSFAPELFALPQPTGQQGSFLADDLEPLDFWSKPELTAVGG